MHFIMSFFAFIFPVWIGGRDTFRLHITQALRCYKNTNLKMLKIVLTIWHCMLYHCIFIFSVRYFP